MYRKIYSKYYNNIFLYRRYYDNHKSFILNLTDSEYQDSFIDYFNSSILYNDGSTLSFRSKKEMINSLNNYCNYYKIIPTEFKHSFTTWKYNDKIFLNFITNKKIHNKWSANWDGGYISQNLKDNTYGDITINSQIYYINKGQKNRIYVSGNTRQEAIKNLQLRTKQLLNSSDAQKLNL